MRTPIDSPPQLPEPRGAISELVLRALRRPPHELTQTLPSHGDVLAGDDDFHLALYVLYELHYRSFEGVDDGWEWEPSLLGLRATLERRFEHALREALPPEPAGGGDDIPPQLKDLLSAVGGPSLSRCLEMRAT